MTVTKLDVGRLGAGARKQIAEEQKKAPARKRPAKRNRFGNIKVKLDGHTFDSRLEARHYMVLRDRQRRGEISGLVCHPVYKLVVAGVQIGKYIGDFEYKTRDGVLVLVDVKSPATRKLPVYRLKRKIVQALYGITITEVG